MDSDPSNTWSYYGIATIYGDMGDAEQAVVYLKKALALDSANVRKAAETQTHFDKIRNNRLSDNCCMRSDMNE
ncbi:tetratricopeptide repeat protein [Anaeroglobus geminatus]|uniref:tetratricopeptide repeat protein n=1 Tax=Anaeroglobus geminatus TaxID=156456 RepID=UPI001FDFBC97|nr:tetratricopeptide repeat protein [Anaeroglobus geminatus]